MFNVKNLLSGILTTAINAVVSFIGGSANRRASEELRISDFPVVDSTRKPNDRTIELGTLVTKEVKK